MGFDQPPHEAASQGMLAITITNERQRRRHLHASGALRIGRAPRDAEHRLVIEDGYVSRDQLVLEETGPGWIRLENCGRQIVRLLEGTQLDAGKSRDVKLPTQFTVGRTMVEIALQATPIAGEDDDTVSPAISTRVALAAYAAQLATISKSFPFPLAYGYRLMCSYASAATHYENQLQLAYNLASFLGGLSLALLSEEQLLVLNKEVDGTALACLRSPRASWLTLASYAAPHLRESAADPLAASIAGLAIDEPDQGFGRIIRVLLEAYAVYQRQGAPAASLQAVEAERLGRLLIKAFDQLDFLADYPLRLIQDVNPRRRSNDVDVVCLNCMGDHPGFKSLTAVYAQHPRKGDLYVELEPGRLCPLYPFLHAADCSQCKAREFFYIDGLQAQVDEALQATAPLAARLRSFEKGHLEFDAEIGENLVAMFAGPTG